MLRTLSATITTVRILFTFKHNRQENNLSWDTTIATIMILNSEFSVFCLWILYRRVRRVLSMNPLLWDFIPSSLRPLPCPGTEMSWCEVLQVAVAPFGLRKQALLGSPSTATDGWEDNSKRTDRKINLMNRAFIGVINSKYISLLSCFADGIEI